MNRNPHDSHMTAMFVSRRIPTDAEFRAVHFMTRITK